MEPSNDDLDRALAALESIAVSLSALAKWNSNEALDLWTPEEAE